MARYFPEPGTTLRGLDGGSYTLAARLGRGGQGVVHRSNCGRFAIKIYGQADPAVQQLRREQLRKVHLARLDDEVFLRSSELLAPPWVGYAMPFLDGYRPIGDLAVPPPGQTSILQGWHSTGGLRVRLHLSMQLARAFHQLHANGLCYGDISFDNVRIPERGAPRIKLIDCDNLLPSGSGRSDVLGTPWFIAPEVLRGAAAPSMAADAHSLAVLTFHLLTLVHPLLGDRVRAGTPDEEEEALEGRLPWIDHPTDDSNRTQYGMPRTATLTVKLQAAFERSFGPGLMDPTLRPTERDWLELFAVALDSLLRGPCGHEFTVRTACPFCGEPAPPPQMLLFQRGTDLETGRPENRPVVLSGKVPLTARHLRFGGSALDERTLLGADPRSDGTLRLVNKSDEDLLLQDKSGTAPRRVRPGAEGQMSRGESLRIGEHGVRGVFR